VVEKESFSAQMHTTAQEKGFWSDLPELSQNTLRLATLYPELLQLMERIELIRATKYTHAWSVHPECKRSECIYGLSLETTILTPSEVKILSKLVLVVSEVGEAIEALLEGNKKGLKEELADIVVRAADISGFLGAEVLSEAEKKWEKNKNRPFMHGKNA